MASGDSETRLFGVVDTAQDPRLYDLVIASSEQECLFSGKLAAPLARAAPYLCVLSKNDGLVDAWRTDGLGRNWGITLRSGATLQAVRRQLRKNLQAMLPDGTVALFRFYDPRVWRTYLPTCAVADLKGWFGQVTEYQAESEDGAGRVTYRLGPGGLEVS